ncbi:uncharacterized protein LOC100575034 [Acyrthosiphon pisum]|uniref:Uncharacterized protein n=1 Tax=Acyrthosiphon pisum TaxID=7029 RepID=A0A8R1WBR5_ACYPI|nr:uncharacterized protein LOC100575034 [Acyrthosiphon pisum]|eukprot:XP_003246628.1 PREDICTED: uncharacterized protein LOC100575034 [Acyrthosiphon pisum]
MCICFKRVCQNLFGDNRQSDNPSIIIVNPASRSSKGSSKKNKNQNDLNEMHVIAHNLQQGPSADGPSVNPETIEAGNVQITIKHNDRDTAIIIAKGEEAEVNTSKGQKKKQPIKKDTAETRKNERKSPRKNSPRKK